MRKKRKKGQHIYCLPPCPAYDVEGMESWLCDMAQKGFLLIEDGFFAGVATFEYDEPQTVRYRLEAAQKSTSMWAADGGEPDPQQIAMSEKYAWDYIAKRRDFYIYRSFDPNARELNTDPTVQSLALNSVKKRRRFTLFYLIFWLVLYCGVSSQGLLITVISMKTWLFLLTAVLVLWILGDLIAELISLSRWQKKLLTGGIQSPEKNWRRGAVRYHGRNVLQFTLTAIILCIFLNNWSRSVMNENEVPLSSYGRTLPFATMRDFAGENAVNYRETMSGLSMSFNTVDEWTDFLAPRCIRYNEHAEITLADGEILDGGLYIEYYETMNPTIAQWLVKELYRLEKREKSFSKMEAPALHTDVDFAAAYQNMLHRPTLLLQKENIVIRASFYQLSSSHPLDFDEWADIVAASIM